MHSSVCPDELLSNCKRKMQEGTVMHHRFLQQFQCGELDRARLGDFLIQWFKISTAHRQSFPALIANIKDDDIRFDLISILNEEYGDGDRSRIHVRLLERLLGALALDVEERRTPPLPSVVAFASELPRIWAGAAAPFAFGVHFGLEYLASAQQRYCAMGMRCYSFLTPRDREYFEVHAEAEPRHVAASERGFRSYAARPGDCEALSEGIAEAERLLGAMWDEFNHLLFERECA